MEGGRGVYNDKDGIGGSATLSGCGVTLFMLHCFIVIPRRRCRSRCCCCLGNETHRKVDKKATTK